MRVGLITTGYPHARDPVSGAFVRGMARALARRGHQVRVLCAARPDDAPALDAGVTVEPVRYAPVPALARTFYGAGAPDNLAARDPLAWLGALAFPLCLAARARRALAPCDALVSHFALPCGLVAGLVRGDRPHLLVAHGTDAHLLARAPAPVQRAVLAGATSARFTHRAALARMDPSAVRGARVSVGPMGFDPAPPLDAAARARARGALGAGEPDVVVLAVARLVPVKGLDALVRAASRAGSRGLVLAVAGDGPERAALERDARARGVRAVFTGVVDAARRDELLRAADVFALPSRALAGGRTEGAPTALVEAMGAGLAVVTSDAGGAPELVGSAGVVVPSGDDAALARALDDLARDADLRAALGARAAERAAAWRWDAQAERVERELVTRAV